MNDDRNEQFVRLLLAHERKLFTYAFSLLANAEDAREIVQDAAVTMWQQFAEYDRQRPFFPWAGKFVYFRALRLRRERQGLRRGLSDEALQAIADDFTASVSELDLRVDALAHCVDKLPPESRTLLQDRYHEDRSVQEIAAATGRSANALYKALDRIKAWLLECVERKITEAGA